MKNEKIQKKKEKEIKILKEKKRVKWKITNEKVSGTSISGDININLPKTSNIAAKCTYIQI